MPLTFPGSAVVINHTGCRTILKSCIEQACRVHGCHSINYVSSSSKMHSVMDAKTIWSDIEARPVVMYICEIIFYLVLCVNCSSTQMLKFVGTLVTPCQHRLNKYSSNWNRLYILADQKCLAISDVIQHFTYVWTMTEQHTFMLAIYSVVSKPTFGTTSWWRHDMEMRHYTLLALYEGNHRSPVDSPHKSQ